MTHRTRNTFLATVAATVLAASPAAAQTPATADNGEWLSLSGTVQAVSGDSFVLDYGRNTITVEMDDYDWYDENAIIVGDEVTATGRVDDDFLQTRRLEASSVYVDSIHTRFYASAADEEDFVPAVDAPIVSNSGILLTGIVESIDGDEMIVDADVLDYKVDTGTLYYDPFDEEGLQHVQIGDRVSITGRFDDSDFFDSPEIDATSVIEINV